PYLKVDAGHVMPFGLARLLAGDVHCFSSINELPPDAPDRAYLVKRDVKSAITIPLVVAGRVIGSVGFATRHRERQWHGDVVGRLRLIAGVFASALARKSADADFRSAVNERLEFETLIADLASQFVNVDSD